MGNCFLGTLNPFQSINAVQIVFVYIENAVAVEKNGFTLACNWTRGDGPLWSTFCYAMPMKVMIIRVRSIEKTASMMGMATSIGWCFGLAPEATTQRTKWPINVPIVIVAGNRMVACTALMVPSAYNVAAVAAPAALAKKAEISATIASPGKPKIAITGEMTLPMMAIRPVIFKNRIRT